MFGTSSAPARLPTAIQQVKVGVDAIENIPDDTIDVENNQEDCDKAPLGNTSASMRERVDPRRSKCVINNIKMVFRGLNSHSGSVAPDHKKTDAICDI